MKKTQNNVLSNKKWKTEDLEYIDCCPVCKNEQSKIIHYDLIDNVYHCAPGKWLLYECKGCESAYLNPRPDRNSIQKAYINYYTHTPYSQKREKFEQLTYLAKVKRIIANGYRNWRFGGSSQPSNRIGIFIFYLIPRLRLEIDQLHRHLPKLPTKGGRVLDVGFGDGSFLDRVISIGWDAVGVDFDAKVVESARMRGLNVYLGGIDILQEREGYFDVITLSHVIEHLHDPIDVLKTCYKLLKPGGILWLESPNIRSYGHDVYAKNWRGIETPRHLVIFTGHSLTLALSQIGFETITMKKRLSPIKNMFFQSELLKMNNENNMSNIQFFIFSTKVIAFRILSALFPRKNEFITLQCKKHRHLKPE